MWIDFKHDRQHRAMMTVFNNKSKKHYFQMRINFCSVLVRKDLNTI